MTSGVANLTDLEFEGLLVCCRSWCLARPGIGDGRACLCFEATWRATLGVTGATSVATALLAAAAAVAAAALSLRLPIWLLLLLLLLLARGRLAAGASLSSSVAAWKLRWPSLEVAMAMLGGGDGCGVQLGPLTGLGGWLARKKESTNNCLPATLRRLSVSPCSGSHSMGMNDAPASSAASRNSSRKRVVDSRGSRLNGADKKTCDASWPIIKHSCSPANAALMHPCAFSQVRGSSQVRGI